MIWEHTGNQNEIHGKDKRWTVSTYKLKIDMDEIAGKYGINIIGTTPTEDKHEYPTTIFYQFFNENGDLYEDQKQYAKLLSFRIDRDMKNKIGGCTIASLKHYQTYGKNNAEKVVEKFNEKNAGKYEMIDFYIDYEIKGSYAIMYFQYKIKSLF